MSGVDGFERLPLGCKSTFGGAMTLCCEGSHLGVRIQNVLFRKRVDIFICGRGSEYNCVLSLHEGSNQSAKHLREILHEAGRGGEREL